MLKNYLRIAYRTLLRNKSYVIINTFGLGIALACCITSYLLVAFNIEFDNFHANEKVQDVYKIHAHFPERESDKTFEQILVPYALGPAIVQDIAGVEKFTRYISWNGYMRSGDVAFGENIHFADSTFLSMFDFPLVAGRSHSFNDKSSIFLSQQLATKYFGEEEAVGKTLILNFANEKELQLVVGGVFDKIPMNNSFFFSSLVRIENFFDINNLDPNGWSDWRSPSTFVSLASSVDPENVSKQLAKYVKVRNEVQKDAVVKSYKLEHFKSKFTEDRVRGSYVNLRTSLVPVVAFVSMAFIILLIACFNLTNTSIALTSKRVKEVGVRKAIGAARRQIVSQFLLETTLTIILSLIVGLLFAQFLVPAFTQMWNLPYGLEELSGVNLVIMLLTLVFMASLLAGVYPAIFQSGFKPVSLLKGSVKIEGTNLLTRSLVGLQFALSVIVLVGGVMFIRNMQFQQQITVGYDKDRTLVINIQNEKEFEAMRDVLTRNSKVQNVGVTAHHVNYDNYESPVLLDTTKYQSRLMGVGRNYCEAMGFTLLQGRMFNMDNESDVQEGLIVNKAFIKKLGLTQPLDNVITVHGKKRRIIGVIDNFVDNLYRSKDPEPFAFYGVLPESYKTILVRVNAKSDLGDVQKYAEKSWKELFPSTPFSSQFQDDVIMENLRRVNGNLQKIFLFLTVLGGILSASGIYSLASLNIAKRTKEIGIRKALGASVRNVVLLLNREFVVILSLAAVLGGVAGYYLTKLLMDEIYAYHIVIGVIPIILCGLAVFVIGILTTSTTIYKAARANPVDSLRTE